MTDPPRLPKLLTDAEVAELLRCRPAKEGLYQTARDALPRLLELGLNLVVVLCEEALPVDIGHRLGARLRARRFCPAVCLGTHGFIV